MSKDHCFDFHCYWGGVEDICSCSCGPCVLAKEMEEAGEHEIDVLARESAEDEQAKYH